MACKECEEMEKLSKEEPVRSWNALPKITEEEVPDDLELICGSDEQMRSWRYPLAYLINRISALEKEVSELKGEKHGK